MNNHVYKVVRKYTDGKLYSWSPAHNGNLEYKLDEKTVQLPNSLGIFVFNTYRDAYNYDAHRNVTPKDWSYTKAIFKCLYTGSLFRVLYRIDISLTFDFFASASKEELHRILEDDCFKDRSHSSNYPDNYEVYTVESITPIEECKI